MIRMYNQLKNNPKNMILAVSLFLLCVTLLLCFVFRIGTIHAYLKDTDQAINTLVIGNNKITIEEPFEEPKRGEKTVKEPSVKNTGSVDCYVRGRILISDSRAEDYVTFYDNEAVGFNVMDWKDSEDGWIYYTHVLKAGEVSEPLFTHIKLSDGMPDLFQGTTVDVIFESVQVQGFATAQEAFQALETQEGDL